MIQQLLENLISSHENDRWALMRWNCCDARTQQLRAVDTVTRGCATGMDGEAVIWKLMLQDGWLYLGKWDGCMWDGGC
jgi:hypothetical protein